MCQEMLLRRICIYVQQIYGWNAHLLRGIKSTCIFLRIVRTFCSWPVHNLAQRPAIAIDGYGVMQGRFVESLCECLDTGNCLPRSRRQATNRSPPVCSARKCDAVDSLRPHRHRRVVEAAVAAATFTARMLASMIVRGQRSYHFGSYNSDSGVLDLVCPSRRGNLNFMRHIVTI